MKYSIIILLLILAKVSVAQEIDSTTLKSLAFLEKFTHAVASDLFAEKETESKLDKDYKLPWDNALLSKNQIKVALDTLQNNATINIEKGHFLNHVLEFKSYFPEFINKGLTGQFKISIKESRLFADDEQLKIQNTGFSGFGSESSFGFENGNSFSHNWRTINTSFNIETELQTEELEGTVEGAVEFECGFVDSYKHVKITKSDIGKEMTIGEHRFLVKDIVGSSVILDFRSNAKGVDFELINLNDEGHKIIGSDMSLQSHSMFEVTYLAFKENKNLSLENYKKIVHPKYLKMLAKEELANWENSDYEDIFGQEYKVITSSAKLANAYLYIKEYDTKVIEIKYDQERKVKKPSVSVQPKINTEQKLRFEKEDKEVILLGKEIMLYNESLKPIKDIEQGVVVKTVGKSYKYFNSDNEIESCQSYNYVKINYQETEYLVAGKHVFEMEKLGVQVEGNDGIEFMTGNSNDYLLVYNPDGSHELCRQITYFPIIIKETKNNSFGLIDVVKNEQYSTITSEYIDADFFQSDGNVNIYDRIKNIEKANNGYVLIIRRDKMTIRVFLEKIDGSYQATYLK